MKAPRHLPDVAHARPGRTAVYRFYDRRGVLLYVGITNSPRHRFEQHAADKEWWPAVTGRTIEWCASRRAALEAEWFAIKNERPIHNKQHNDHYRGGSYVPARGIARPAFTMVVSGVLLGAAWTGHLELSWIMQAVCVLAFLTSSQLILSRAE
jgi:predicted GIY-YIG superfamily endonuclease